MSYQSTIGFGKKLFTEGSKMFTKRSQTYYDELADIWNKGATYFNPKTGNTVFTNKSYTAVIEGKLPDDIIVAGGLLTTRLPEKYIWQPNKFFDNKLKERIICQPNMNLNKINITKFLLNSPPKPQINLNKLV